MTASTGTQLERARCRRSESNRFMRRRNTYFVRMAIALVVASVFILYLCAQAKRSGETKGGPRSFEIVPLETVSETSSNASIGDLNGDGKLDIVLEKGRHWQLTSRIFFGDGKGHFTAGPPL